MISIGIGLNLDIGNRRYVFTTRKGKTRPVDRILLFVYSPAVSMIAELLTLVRSRYALVGVETHEEDRLENILTEVASELLVPLRTWDRSTGLVHSGTGNSMYNTSRIDQLLAYLESFDEEGIFLIKDLYHNLSDPVTQRALRNASSNFKQDRRCVFLVAPEFDIPVSLEKEILVLPLALPGIDEIKKLIYQTVRGLRGGRVVKVEMTTEEMEQLIGALRGFTLEEAERVMMQVVLEDRKLSAVDIEEVIDLKQRTLMRDVLLDFTPSDQDLGDVAGLDNLKSWLERRRGAFGSKAREFGLDTPKGILLLGVQGCGKSLCAKAVAREWNLPLLRLDPARLYDKYIGESERKLREAIQTAEAMSPAILWIDEIEKGLGGIGGSDADGGLSKRMLGTFLNWLQEKKTPVFVIATANDITSLPPELIRKGRFDEIFFIDLPDEVARREIFRIQLQRREREPGHFDLDLLASASEGFSGAEIEQAVVGALYLAFSDAGGLTTDHIVAELVGTKPLSATMAEKVDALRSWAEDRTVSAG
ncbi:AAA family ATPase [Gemmatimonadota bacterium]